MLAAVGYLHTKTIAHRDLKLANFVFEDKSENAELKLIDFGLSKVKIFAPYKIMSYSYMVW
jgi:serine/threonine protein kinase